jgi:hypothetical protein
MKKIVKSIVIIIAWLSAVSANAHQPDISSLTLIEQQPGQWMLQLNASLTAFQYEVRNAYGEDSYASPEEFNQLLLKYLRGQISIQVNGEDVILGNGLVQLGHAATVAFEITEVPEVLENVFVRNKGFENIHHSQVIFVIVNEGFEKNHFLLNEANNFQLDVSMKDNQVLSAAPSWFDNRATLVTMLIITGLVGFVLYKTSFRKTAITPKRLLHA